MTRRFGRVGGLAAAIIVLFGMGILAQEPDPALPPPDPIEGVWRTLLASEITIAACEVGFCGTLSTIVVPSEGLTAEDYAAAQAMPVESYTDQRNPDPALRDRPMLGLQILTLLPSSKPNVYDGEIYNPEDGNTYSGYVELLGPDALRLNGCVLFNVICRGEDWVRVVDSAEEIAVP